MPQKETNGRWVEVSITKQMYGWSKHGGGRHGAVFEDLDEWSCQCCGEKQLRGFPAYMIDFDGDQREFVRVCAFCKFQSIERGLGDFITWPDEMRRPMSKLRLARLANLLTIPAKYGL